jgi:tRNA nucleotidyltransferase (CCA-adding enzyme)
MRGAMRRGSPEDDMRWRRIEGFQLPRAVEEAVLRLRGFGALPYLVGGAVRDLLLGTPVKDFDFEVYGIGAADLESVLSTCGRVETVGASFGITKLWTPDGHEVDFALPRSEVATGRGHRDFAVTVDPTLDPSEACKRRDFTWNALMLDCATGEVIDHFGGIADLEKKVIRHVSDRFAEDPLRPLRAMQFAARFEMRVAPETADVCKGMRSAAATLPSSRLWGEWRKWALSAHPGMGLEALADIGWHILFDSLWGIVGLPQDPKHHPEGSVWRHTILAVDAAARIATADHLDDGERISLVFAALLHDVGKASTTVADAEGRITAKGHEDASADLCPGFCDAIGMPAEFRDRIVPLVREHMAHLSCPTPSKRFVRRLAARLAPASIVTLGQLARADAWARPPVGGGDPMALHVALARDLAVQDKPQPGLLLGRHLVALGMKPGRDMGALLREALEAQMDGEFDDLDDAIGWATVKLQRRDEA